MVTSIDDDTLLTSKLKVKPESLLAFADWQAEFNAAIAMYPGFVSLEILSPFEPKQPEWLIIQRFRTSDEVRRWHSSEERKKLMDKVYKYTVCNGKSAVEDMISSAGSVQGTVTEVIIAQVHPDNETAYRAWTAKMHQAEAKFPGFRGVYMQSPVQNGGVNWITLLQFDRPENLDRWMNSPERQRLLAEGKGLIHMLENQRMVSPYAGWFASIANTGRLPPVWKQTMIVLLLLFPIVMIELKYLEGVTSGLHLSLATFIGNAISVSLISWPMTPIAILFLGWWLVPKGESSSYLTVLGTVIVLLLYAIEIAIFWTLY